MPGETEARDTFDSILSLPKSDKWKCYRCGIVLPSPHDGHPPITCIPEAGGCGRTSDDESESEAGYTRFFPADWGDAKITLWISNEMDEAKKAFSALVNMWKHYIEFSDPSWHSILLSLFVIQTYIYKILPSVFYVGITGPSGSAKTAILEILRSTCYNPVMTWNASVSALARKLDTGCTALIDEIDELDSEKKDLIQGAARTGYRPGSVYMRYDYKHRTFEEIKNYGPKAFSFLTSIEEALKSRTIEIPTIRTKDDPVNRVLDNMGRPFDSLPNEVKALLEKAISKKLETWNTDKVRDLIRSEQFRNKVRQAVGDRLLPRNIELAASCLLVAEIVGVDIRNELYDAIKSQDVFRDEEVNEVLDFLRVNYSATDQKSIRLSDIRDGLNRKRKETGDRAMSPRRFRAILREIGFIENRDIKRLPGAGHYVLELNDNVRLIIGTMDPDEYFRKGGWFSDAIETEYKKEDDKLSKLEDNLDSMFEEGADYDKSLLYDVPDSKSQNTYLRAIATYLQERSDDGTFSVEDLSYCWTMLGGSPGIPNKWINRWIEIGEVMSPKMGRYKFVG